MAYMTRGPMVGLKVADRNLRLFFGQRSHWPVAQLKDANGQRSSATSVSGRLASASDIAGCIVCPAVGILVDRTRVIGDPYRHVAARNIAPTKTHMGRLASYCLGA